MGFSREMDAGGLLLCRYQAEIFDASLSLPCGSKEFIKRFVYSSFCWEFDSLAIASRPVDKEAYLESLRKLDLPSKGEKFKEEEMHWIGYIYRYWAYTDNISSKKVYKMMPPAKIRPFFEAYHGLDPKQAIDIWKKEFHLVPTLDDMASVYGKIYKKGKPKFKKV